MDFVWLKGINIFKHGGMKHDQIRSSKCLKSELRWTSTKDMYMLLK